ncbi:hypothetical protein CDAR_125311 [Caerostris darwini]|uniref:Uncharacterized protein n=1 Tax=Caerostris darwini TaxID=1538125 RepID=A0AAV4Q626_9ARAC|nr:hypothetical protein CDAR_125311 [Caerostris darwini]
MVHGRWAYQRIATTSDFNSNDRIKQFIVHCCQWICHKSVLTAIYRNNHVVPLPHKLTYCQDIKKIAWSEESHLSLQQTDRLFPIKCFDAKTSKSVTVKKMKEKLDQHATGCKTCKIE